MTFKLGSISTGTLRTEDLLERFTEALSERGVNLDTREMMADGAGEAAAFDKSPNEERLQSWVVDRLMEELQELCPPFVYFGAHPGDGADFGFWPEIERMNEECRWARMGVDAAWMPPEETTLEDDGVIVHVNDHGNVTVMDLERNELWSAV
jgi:hypothetical protein